MAESLIFPVELDVRPEVQAAGRTWFRRPELHVTTLNPEAVARATGLDEARVVEAAEELRDELTAVRAFRFDGRVARARDDEGRHTLVAFCAVEGLEQVFRRLDDRLAAAVPRPPTHVTLYTAEPGMGGVGLATAAQAAERTEPLPQADAATVLAAVSQR